MSFKPQEFTSIRPYLFHTTAVENLPGIRATQSLLCAASFTDWPFSKQRSKATQAKLNGIPAWLQTQGRLHAGNCDFEQGWTMASFVELLNQKIFFWPGAGKDEPIDYGVRHRDKNDWPSKWATIRVESHLLIHAAHFAKCNSGSPRISNAIKAKRGARTFMAASEFEGTARNVVEVVFHDEVKLPDTTHVSYNRNDFWEPL